ncbi:murein L,D-transpeptidase [Mesobaculum littorinae]|uniref:Murein L,D-transpeptidase n=2 Tax=Mesobaculum littorinae TaxID=2486419 RepID=A0A438AMW0_9RHOB|nr:murein L,D-transpeptidase [Mesobaculum littorinae]
MAQPDAGGASAEGMPDPQAAQPDATTGDTEPDGTSASDPASDDVASGQQQASRPLPPTPDQIEAARYDGGPLPEKQSALTARLQILLDRAGVSPGVIDGWKGGMSESAIHAFEVRLGLPADGVLDMEVWQLLGGDSAMPMLQSYTITDADVADISAPLPSDYGEMAQLDHLGYTSVAEKLAERFHMDEEFLEQLNPDAAFVPGETLTVANPGADQQGTVTRIEVRKQTSRLAAFDATGRMIANYPVTIGSSDTPSPSGVVEVEAVAWDPTYSYDPSKNFQQGDNDEFLTIPPGPNGPVGSVWIDLSKPTYGLHGTPNPSSLFKNNSHGCVRLTNWDVTELGRMVERSRAVVEFVE